MVQTGEQPDRNGPRRLDVIKTNLCRYPDPLGLTLEPGDPRAPTLRYGEPPQPHREATQEEECQAWLLQLLEEAGEPLRPKDVIAMAEEEGFPERPAPSATGRCEASRFGVRPGTE